MELTQKTNWSDNTSSKSFDNELIIRSGTVDDAQALADFQAINNSLTETPNEEVRLWTQDLANGTLPGFDPSDFTIVEDITTGTIVSSLNLISQLWSYGKIEFSVGRIELVATHPNYRRRGLVRTQIAMVHKWSASRGNLVQAITGIPWYYRQFGYEMALENLGGKFGNTETTGLKLEAPEQYRVRHAKNKDLPFLVKLYRCSMERYLVSCVRNSESWQYELNGRSEGATHRREIRVIEDKNSQPIGYLLHSPQLDNSNIVVKMFELSPGFSWDAVTSSVTRYLHDVGQELAKRNRCNFETIFWSLGTDHPVYRTADIVSNIERPYAWYLRLPDLAKFVSRISPVLEENIAKSPFRNYSGKLRISFVSDGLQMEFNEGRLTDTTRWMPTQLDSRLVPQVRDALFPNLTFLQLLFGFRSVSDLEYAFPDCIISSDHSREFLNTLFPKRPSNIWGIE